MVFGQGFFVSGGFLLCRSKSDARERNGKMRGVLLGHHGEEGIFTNLRLYIGLRLCELSSPSKI